ILVIDDNDRQIKQGGMGEICVRGSSLALGYYNDPERTAQAFRQNPAHNDYPERVYYTGDLAILNERGEYVFASRKDFQIKHMGHRIELGEIDTYASAVEDMRRVCSIFDEKRNKIVLFYEGPMDRTVIIAELKKKLPKYMIPNIFIQLESMPINKTGKIDRKALKNMLSETH
ncbi:MAG: AMP-binding protein, partial [Pyramidobacter sp.]|nr:AMP-binding protein [Pyramidobacter sp.]